MNKTTTLLVFLIIVSLLLPGSIADKKYVKKRHSNCLSKDSVEIYDVST
jgi:hypothetical protein